MNLPDALLDAARERAAAQHRTLTSLVEEALRELLARPLPPPGSTRLPTSGNPKARLLVDLDDKEAVWTLLDADGPR